MHQKVDTRIRLALIYGSSREGRFCDKVAGWAISQIAGDGPFAATIEATAATVALDSTSDRPECMAW